jgi:hypothetical protein
MDRHIARPHGACKGCGKRTIHFMYNVWGYCGDCSDALKAMHEEPNDHDSFDEAREINQ